MLDKIQSLVKTLRLGAIVQDERKVAVLELGMLFQDERLISHAAQALEKIGTPTALDAIAKWKPLGGTE